MEKLLRDVTENVPYTNVGKLFLANGRDFPSDRLGGNCVYINTLLKKRLEDDSYGVHVLSANNGIHYALLAVKNGKTFFLDASVLQRDPISIDEMRASSAPWTWTHAYPRTKGGELSQLRCAVDDRTFVVDKCGRGIRSHRYTYHFPFRPEPLPALDDLSIASVEVERMILRVLDEDGGEIRLSQYIETGGIFITKNGPEGLLQYEGYRGYNLGFERALERIEARTATSREEIFDLFADGIDMYSGFHREKARQVMAR